MDYGDGPLVAVANKDGEQEAGATGDDPSQWSSALLADIRATNSLRDKDEPPAMTRHGQLDLFGESQPSFPASSTRRRCIAPIRTRCAPNCCACSLKFVRRRAFIGIRGLPALTSVNPCQDSERFGPLLCRHSARAQADVSKGSKPEIQN